MNADQDRHFDESDLRVVFLTAAYHIPDGVTMTINRISTYLKGKGAETMIVTADPQDEKAVFPKGENVVVVDSSVLPFDNDKFKYCMGMSFSENARQQVLKFKPTIMHLTVPDLVGREAVKWAEQNDIPTIATWHSNYADYLTYYGRDWLRPILEAYLRSFYKQLITFVPTPYISSKMVESGFQASQIRVWGRGVDRELFNPSKRRAGLREQWGIQPHEIAILWAGRTVIEKRPDIYGAVIERLVKEGHPVRGVVAGGAGVGTKFMQHPCIRHLGWLDGEGLAEAYAACDILLFPSGVETFGNVTLEAMASGVPGVVDEGCSGHLIQNGDTGFVCKTNCLEHYYESTKKLVTDTQLRQQMARSARASSEAWGMSIVMRRMANNYRDLASMHKNGTAPKANSAVWVWSVVAWLVLCIMYAAEWVTRYVPFVTNVTAAVSTVSSYFFSAGLYYTCRSQKPTSQEYQDGVTEGISSEASSLPGTPTSKAKVL